MRWIGVLIWALLSVGRVSAERPNIVWFVVDDMSPHFSCYGEKLISTPNVDALAERGVRFDRAFVTAPVCSPCRSALITGCYQTTIGAHHHRSGRGKEKIYLPAGVEPIPVLLQRAGYFTCVGGPLVAGSKNLGKTDYNFEHSLDMYNANDWSTRKPGQPFFAQIQLHGGKYRGQGPDRAWKKLVATQLAPPTSPAAVLLPPYYPRDPVLLEDWADYLDTVRYTDRQVGEVMDRLKRESLLKNTVIIFLTDHGISHARGKQFLYDEGLHIPLVIAGPGFAAGEVRHDLVEHIDVAATTLAIAGVSLPSKMQGKDLFAKDFVPRPYVFAARDRCDETVDYLRSVRSERYKYIRNYLPNRPHLQPNRYKDGKRIVQRLRELHAQGQLEPLAEKLLFAPTRPKEELYDLQEDPFETINRAEDPDLAPVLKEMREQLARWEAETGDLGRTPESASMYDSDMAVYGSKPNAPPGQRSAFDNNIALMKQWAKEGK